MFFILAVQGCLPYVDLMLNEEGETLTFDNKELAEAYAKENCACEYRIVEF